MGSGSSQEDQQENKVHLGHRALPALHRGLQAKAASVPPQHPGWHVDSMWVVMDDTCSSLSSKPSCDWAPFILKGEYFPNFPDHLSWSVRTISSHIRKFNFKLKCKIIVNFKCKINAIGHFTQLQNMNSLTGLRDFLYFFWWRIKGENLMERHKGECTARIC